MEGKVWFGVENAGKKREKEALRNSKGQLEMWAEERWYDVAAEETREI